jgi:hypothetical protein
MGYGSWVAGYGLWVRARVRARVRVGVRGKKGEPVM